MQATAMRFIRMVLLGLAAGLLLAACGSGKVDKLTAALKAAQQAYHDGDYRTAVPLFQALAEQGNVRAEFFLGDIYLNGRGVPQDYAQALQWSQRAAEQGDTDAQFTLGQIYERGLGVPQDNLQAHIWYNLSASSGDERATRKRDELATKLSGAQLEEARRREKQWLDAHRAQS